MEVKGATSFYFETDPTDGRGSDEKGQKLD